MDSKDHERLMELIEYDEIYQVYQKSWEELQMKFRVYERFLPMKYRRMLWGLVEMAQLRQCRALLLACEHMEFKEK